MEKIENVDRVDKVDKEEKQGNEGNVKGNMEVKAVKKVGKKVYKKPERKKELVTRREKRELEKSLKAVSLPASRTISRIVADKSQEKRIVYGDIVNKSTRPRQIIIDGRVEYIAARGRIKGVVKSDIRNLPESVMFVPKK